MDEVDYRTKYAAAAALRDECVVRGDQGQAKRYRQAISGLYEHFKSRQLPEPTSLNTSQTTVTGFTPDELQLNFTAWSALVDSRRKDLDPNVREWLGRWRTWDLFSSPMDDNERRMIRYGHHLGWFGRDI